MKTIEVDPFDIQSINKAIKELEHHEVVRKQRITEYIHKLCLKGAEAANKTYNSKRETKPSRKRSKSSSIFVEVLPDGKGIKAKGDQVVFLEFGTGVKVRDHELSAPLPVEIMPGSWSESPEGKHTWSTWLQGGEFKGKWIQRRFEDYPYNTEPRPGMWEAYKAIQAAQEQLANEVFNK